MIALGYILLAVLVASPLLWVAVPVMVDYPNHLVRMGLMTQALQGGVHDHYVVNWQIIPNLAMEGTVPFLAQFMPLETAGRLFVAVAMLLPVLGCMALRRALFGTVGLWPLSAFLFVYNAVLYWGFVNYLFGLGVALICFAGWIRTRNWHLIPRVIAFACAAGLLFLLHLFAFGVYGILVAAFEARAMAERRSAVPVLNMFQFLPACVLWVIISGHGGPRYTAYGGLGNKLYALSATMAFGDLGPMLGLTLIGLCYLAWRRRMFSIVPEMRWPLLALAAVGVAMPTYVMGSWQADIRIPVAFPFLLIASVRLAPLGARAYRLIAWAAASVLVVRVAGLTVDWIDLDRRFDEFRGAMRTVPFGARLLVVQSTLVGRWRIDGLPLWFASRLAADFFHMPELSILDRGAFTPYLFTGWTTISPAPRDADRAVSQGLPVTPQQLQEALAPDAPELRDELGERAYWAGWPGKYDFVVWINPAESPPPPPAAEAELARYLRPVAAGSFFRIYRIAAP